MPLLQLTSNHKAILDYYANLKQLSLLHATDEGQFEVMLLPYYIAAMNIEHEYAERMNEYKPFDGFRLVDTFERIAMRFIARPSAIPQNASRVFRVIQALLILLAYLPIQK